MDCAHIPEINYSDFGQRIKQKVTKERIPVSGSLELNFRCNLSCQHCYVSHGHTGIPGKTELTTSEIHRIMDEVVDAGCLWFLITGGEPLIRRDFLEIYTYAKRKGLLVSIFTNGTMITERTADYLADWRPFKVEITLHGYTQKTYEKITGIPGSHSRCMRGIELLMERKIPLRLKTMLMTLNQHEIQDMQDFAESLDIEFKYDGMLNAGVNGSGDPIALRIPPESIIQFDKSDPKRIKALQLFTEMMDGYSNERNSLYACGAGMDSFHIDPYGQLSLCMMTREPSYDLRKGSFIDGWENFLGDLRYQQAEEDYACNQCKLLPLCGQCPGWAMMEHGDPQKPVEYLCHIAHLRAELLQLEG
ncbi:radical SAM protein [Chloroflexota bacterium]